MSELKNVNVLVVDDEEALREIFTDELTYLGAQVFCAKNGEEALDLYKQHSIDVVISDVRMPGGDGVQLVKNIASLPKPFPKIFMCSGYMDKSTDEILELGVLEIFAKPFDWDFIFSSVIKSLEKK